MVTMLATSLSFANDGTFLLRKKDEKTTAITLVDVKKGNLLSIKDANGIVLFEESIKKNGIYNKGFDLSELPNGQYLFELDKDAMIQMIPFEVLKNEVIFNEKEEKTLFKPFVKVNENMVFISKLAINKEPLKIELYYEDKSSSVSEYSLLHSETISNTQKIERIYKLSAAKKGTYKLVFVSEGKEYIKYINNWFFNVLFSLVG